MSSTKNKASQPAATSPDAKKRKTYTPRAPRSASERLPKLYHGLTDQVEEGHFDNAKKTCRKILALEATSIPAYQTLLFLHLQTDDYPAALDLLSTPPPAGTLSLDFEKAYCLYRLHREKEALEILEKVGSNGRREKHLEAQIRYRLGEYPATQELYESLLKGINSSSSEYPDIQANIEATSAHTDFLSQGYQSHLTAPSTNASASSSTAYFPTEGELESYVPSLPTGWATGGIAGIKAKAPITTKAGMDEKKRDKPRHKLPKGANSSKPPNNEDPERWMPLRQRASYITQMSKRKGVKESMGTGFTQGSTSSAAVTGGAGGGNKNKKKGKK